MNLDEARELVNGPLWPSVREDFLATGVFRVHPAGDERRLGYLDASVRERIALWMKAIPQVPAWRKVIDGKTVRRLRSDYPGVYPDVLRYEAYFYEAKGSGEGEGRGGSPCLKKDVLKTLLKIKFPEAYQLCYS